MRQTERQRKTGETDIVLRFSAEGGGIDVQTGIGFFDHMLTAFAKHGGFGLTVRCEGDLQVDGHHTVEDVGIVLGMAVRDIWGDGRGIERFGHSYVPMDEALGFAAADVGGRGFLQYTSPAAGMIGGYDSALTLEFWRAFCGNAAITLHLRGEGDNAHHITEALFKAAGRALGAALSITGEGYASTKGGF